MNFDSISPGRQPPPPLPAASTPADLIMPVIEDARWHLSFSYWLISLVVCGIIVIVGGVAWLVKYFTTPAQQPPGPMPDVPAAATAAHPSADPQPEVWIAPPPIAHYFPRRRRPEIVLHSYPDQPSESTIDMAGSSHA